MKQFKSDTRHYTYSDYLTWPEDRSGELIDGVAYVREPPAPSWSHQRVVTELVCQINAVLRDKPCRVLLAPFDVLLPRSSEEDDQIDTVVQPDVSIVCEPRKPDARGMRGAPEWIAEVLSPSTARHDRFVKVPAYERAGVREVWLIHPIEFTLTIYRLEAGRYASPAILELKGQTQLTAVPFVTIDWDDMVARM